MHLKAWKLWFYASDAPLTMKRRSAGHDANQPISHICCLILREKHFISFSSPHHRLRGRLVSALPARGRRSLSQRQWWRWWRWWRWTGDWFVPAGTVLVWRIKDALWNEIYFLLLGTIIMPKSIFNILGSMTPRILFASLLSANQSESREWSGGEVKSNLFRPQRHKQCWPRRALQSAQLWQEKLQKPFREKEETWRRVTDDDGMNISNISMFIITTDVGVNV